MNADFLVKRIHKTSNSGWMTKIENLYQIVILGLYFFNI